MFAFSMMCFLFLSSDQFFYSAFVEFSDVLLISVFCLNAEMNFASSFSFLQFDSMISPTPMTSFLEISIENGPQFWITVKALPSLSNLIMPGGPVSRVCPVSI